MSTPQEGHTTRAPGQDAAAAVKNLACCGQTPFEVPPWQRMTLDLALVSCGPPVISRCECGGLARHQAGCSWRTGYGSHVIRGEAKP